MTNTRATSLEQPAEPTKLARPKLGDVVFARDQIAARIASIGAALSADYGSAIPVLVCVLKGAAVFTCDLARSMQSHVEMDFLAVTAYQGHRGGGQAQITKDLQIAIAGRDVILVEDVVDTGLTLNFVLRWLATKDPRSVRVVTLLDRPQRRLVECELAYVGFAVPDRFLVGYGFDYQQRYRNLPDLCELEVPDASALIDARGNETDEQDRS